VKGSRTLPNLQRRLGRTEIVRRTKVFKQVDCPGMCLMGSSAPSLAIRGIRVHALLVEAAKFVQS